MKVPRLGALEAYGSLSIKSVGSPAEAMNGLGLGNLSRVRNQGAGTVG